MSVYERLRQAEAENAALREEGDALLDALLESWPGKLRCGSCGARARVVETETRHLPDCPAFRVAG